MFEIKDNKIVKTHKKLLNICTSMAIILSIIIMIVIVINKRHQDVVQEITKDILYSAGNTNEGGYNPDDATIDVEYRVEVLRDTEHGSVPNGVETPAGIINPPSSPGVGQIVTLLQAPEIYNANPGVFCLNSARLSCVIQDSTYSIGDGYRYGTIREIVDRKISIPVSATKPADAKDDDEIQLTEEAKNGTDSDVDGLIGYAIWQWKRKEITNVQLQEILWMSPYIEMNYGNGDAYYAYMRMNQSNSNWKGGATEYGNSGVELASGETPAQGLDALYDQIISHNNGGKAFRSFQYDICYDNVFNRLKTYYMGDINFDGRIDNVDLNKVLNIINNPGKYFPKGMKIAADVNGDGLINSSDYTIIQRMVENTNYREVNKNAYKCDLVTAEVDCNSAQTMVDQKEKKYIVGPYNVKLEFNEEFVQDQYREAIKQEQPVKFSNNGITRTIYDGAKTIPNQILINELLGNNEGETSENQFAWFDKNSLNLTVVNADGYEVNYDNNNSNEPKLVFINSEGVEITNKEEILNMMINGEYFYIQVEFLNSAEYYEEYDRQYLDFIRGFDIKIDFNMKYIDQFYVSRETYRYDESTNSIKTFHYQGEMHYQASLYVEMIKEILSKKCANYDDNFTSGAMDNYEEKVPKNGCTYNIKFKPASNHTGFTWLSGGSITHADGSLGFQKGHLFEEYDTGGFKMIKRSREIYFYYYRNSTDDDWTRVQVGSFNSWDEEVEVNKDFAMSGEGSDHVSFTYYGLTDITLDQAYEGKNGGHVSGTIPSLSKPGKAASNGKYVEGNHLYQEEYEVSWNSSGTSMYRGKSGAYGGENIYYKASSATFDTDENGETLIQMPDKYQGSGYWTGGRYLRWFHYEVEVSIESVAYVGGGTVTNVNGKVKSVHSFSGHTVPITNVLWPKDGDDGRVDSIWYYYEGDLTKEYEGDVVVKDGEEWQDFQKIFDVRYTTEGIEVDIFLHMNNDNDPIDEYYEDKQFDVIRIEGTTGAVIQIGGTVWIDKSEENKAKGITEGVQGKKDNKDKLYEGIEVTLHELYYTGGRGIEIHQYTTVTNSNGEYMFIGLNPMSKYYVTFKYNSQIYQQSYYNYDIQRNSVTSNAKEKSTQRRGNNGNGGINGKLSKIDSDIYSEGDTIRDGDTESANYSNNKRAYGLNLRIAAENGEYISYNEAIAGQGEYFVYGLSNGSNACSDGKDGVLTFGDVYAMYRKEIVEKANKVYDLIHKQTNVDLRSGINTIRITYNGANVSYDRIGNISTDKLDYSEWADFYRTLPNISSDDLERLINSVDNNMREWLSGLGVKQDEIDNILTYIKDLNIEATTNVKTDYSDEYIWNLGDLKTLSNKIIYPIADRFIAEDVNERRAVKADNGSGNIYTAANRYAVKLKSQYKTDGTRYPDHYTLLGMLLRYKYYNRTNNNIYYGNVDYLYSNGVDDYSAIMARDYKNRPISGSTPKNCIKNSINYALMRREISDVHLDKDVNRIITTINGQELSYNYDNKNVKSNSFGTVQKGKDSSGATIYGIDRTQDNYSVMAKAQDDKYNGNLIYNRDIRTGDYLYDEAVDEESGTSKGRNLEVYIQYVIQVENTGDVDVVINSILDYYDNTSMEYLDNEYYCVDGRDKDENGNYVGAVSKTTYYEHNNNTYNNSTFKDKITDTSDSTTLNVSTTKRNLTSVSDTDTNYDYSKVNYLTLSKDEKLLVGESARYYITYKVKTERFNLRYGEDSDYDRNQDEYLDPTQAGLDLGNNPELEKVLLDVNFNNELIRAGKRSIAEIGSYTTYYPEKREVPDVGTSNRVVGGQVAGLVDIDSNPGSLRNIDLYQNVGNVLDEKTDLADRNKAISYVGTIRTHNDIVTTRLEDDMDQAPTVNLVLTTGKDKMRSISGSVFEDIRNKSDEELKTITGNGEIDKNNRNEIIEQLIKGVTVQLVEIKTDIDTDTGIVTGISGERIVGYQTIKFTDTIANGNGFGNLGTEIEEVETSERVSTATEDGQDPKVVKQIIATSKNGEPVAATITFNDDEKLKAGEYSFVNIPAGYYYVRFIYGDNHETVLNNKAVNKTDENYNPVNDLFNYALTSNDSVTIGDNTTSVKDEFNRRLEQIDKNGYIHENSEDTSIEYVQENLTGLNEKSYNGQDYKSTTYNGGNATIKIGNTTIKPYSNDNSTAEDDLTKDQNYESNDEDEKKKLRIVSNIDGKLFSYDNEYYVNNGTYSGSMYTLDKNILKEDAEGYKPYSVAKDVWAYRARANDYGKGFDYSNKTENGANQGLRNYRAEILASPNTLLTYRSNNIKKEKYEDASDMEELSAYEKLMLAIDQKEAIFELEYHTQMVAQTGIIDLSIERDYSNTNTSNAINDDYQVTETGSGNNLNTTSEYHIKNVNFGIEERPKAQLKLDKKVANFKMITQTGTTIVDSNKTQNDFSFEEHIEHGEEYVNKDNNVVTSGIRRLNKVKIHNDNNNSLEMVALALDDELLSGAYVEITYNLKVTNIGDVDYVDKQFYYTGAESNKDHNLSLSSAKTVIDYPSNEFIFSEDDQAVRGKNSIWRTSYGINGIEGLQVSETYNAGNSDYSQNEEENETEPLKIININLTNVIKDLFNNQNSNNAAIVQKIEDEMKKNDLAYETEAELEKAKQRAQEHEHPDWSYDLVNRQYLSLISTYKNILTTRDLGNKLIPVTYGEESITLNETIGTEKYTNTWYKSTNRNLVLTTTVSNVSTDSDLTYNNLAEIVEICNDNGRRMEYSIPGNEEMANQDTESDASENVYTKLDRREVREIDAAIAQKIQIRTPTGADKSYVIMAATVMIALISIAGTIVIIKKNLSK